MAKGQEDVRPAEHVVTDLLTLRGHGTTDIARALGVARAQLDRSRANRRITILLSDGRATVPGDVRAAASALDELWIVAPDDDADDARALARDVGARLTTVTGPAAVPEAFARLLDG